MAGSMRIDFHNEGFDEVRRDPAVEVELMTRGHAIAEAAGGEPDFLVLSEPSKSRARVVVITATPAAKIAEATDRSLTRALDAGR